MSEARHPNDVETLGNRVLEASHIFSEAVSSELQMEPLCDLVVDTLFEIFRPESVLLMFVDEATNELRIKRARGQCEDNAEAFLSRRGGSAPALALEQQRTVCRRGPGPATSGAQAGDSLDETSNIAVAPFVSARGEDGPVRDVGPVVAAVPLLAERRGKGAVVLAWPSGSDHPDDDDLRMLETLAGQVATAIDNAWLYSEITRLNEDLERKVHERTAMLEQSNQQLTRTLEELKQTQTQLVQQEKMASLGQLTAGIAHEINNPLAYSINNIALAEERLAAMELRYRLISTRLSMTSSLGPEDKLSRAASLVDSLASHPDYRDDVAWFRSEASGLEPEVAVALTSEFLRYLEVSEEDRLPHEEMVRGFRQLTASSREGLDRVKTIVLDLRSFSRLDEAQFQNVDIDAGVASTLAIIAHLAKERRVEIAHRRGLTAGPYACFAAKLNQVVLNLVTNALHATEPGGQVTVGTRECPGGPVIEVEDTGVGIPEEHLTKIFDPFFTTKPAGQGTGLGLSISYKIIEEHGGTIRVNTKLGAGTKFTIQLPPRSQEGRPGGQTA